MTGARHLALAIAVLLAAPSFARAQADEPAVDGEGEFADVEESSADEVAPEDVSGAPEELPDDADLGPPLSERPPVLSPEEQRQWRRRHYDPTEPEHPIALQIFVGLGGALDSSLDHALAAHRYGDSPLVFSGDVALLARITEWFYLGGRIGGRGRGWLSNDMDPASAGGIDGMIVAHARAYLGRVVDIGALIGAGIGWGGLSLGRGGADAVAPRLHGSGTIAFRLDSGIRLCARFSWDWFSFYDIDRYGSDLELGGPSLALGLEVRR